MKPFLTSEKGYLYASRERPEELFRGIDRDLHRFREAVDAKEAITPLDHQIMNQALLDIQIGNYLAAWAENQTIPPEVLRSSQGQVQDYEEDLQPIRALNGLFLRDKGLSYTQDMLAEFGSKKVDSILYPRWRPHVLETWIRRGPTWAAVPVLREFFSHTEPPTRNPNLKNLGEAMMRLAIMSESLRSIQQRAIDNMSKEGTRSYFRSMDGLLLEYDAMLVGYDSVVPPDANGVAWNFPAPPNMDFGFGNTEKTDMISVLFRTHGPPLFAMFNVKLKPVNKNIRHSGKVIKLTPEDIGCVALINGEVTRKPGLACDNYISDYLDISPEDKKYGSEQSRFLQAMSFLGISFSYCEAALKETGEAEIITHLAKEYPDLGLMDDFGTPAPF